MIVYLLMPHQRFMKDLFTLYNFTFVRFSLTHHKYQENLLSFFKVVMECYSKTNQSLEFFTDLFELDIHPSESFEIEFSITIKEFITDHNLQKAIYDDIILVLVSSVCRYKLYYVTFPQSKLSLTKNSFTWMIVSTMIKVLLDIAL